MCVLTVLTDSTDVAAHRRGGATSPRRAKREQLANVFAVQSAPDDARLPEKVDLALLVDTYHHIDDRSRYFAKLKGALAPQGRVAIVDFTMDSEVGPPRARHARAGEARVSEGRL